LSLSRISWSSVLLPFLHSRFLNSLQVHLYKILKIKHYYQIKSLIIFMFSCAGTIIRYIYDVMICNSMYFNFGQNLLAIYFYVGRFLLSVEVIRNLMQRQKIKTIKAIKRNVPTTTSPKWSSVIVENKFSAAGMTIAASKKIKTNILERMNIFIFLTKIILFAYFL